MEETKKEATSLQGNSTTITTHDTGNNAASFIPAGAEKVDEGHVGEYGELLDTNEFYVGEDCEKNKPQEYQTFFPAGYVGENYEKKKPQEYQTSFPAGYRFYPLDEELIAYYLEKKINNEELPPNKINDVNIYKHHPQDLVETFREDGGLEKEWYFFTSRDKKYPNGGRPNRLAVGGHWKVNGVDHAITRRGKKIGTRRSLAFHAGKGNKGVKTSWIMHEYTTVAGEEEKSKAVSAGAKDMQLDKWVLCRIYNNIDGCRTGHNYPKTAAVVDEYDGQEDRKGKRKMIDIFNSSVKDYQEDEGTDIGYPNLDMLGPTNNRPSTIKEETHNMRTEAMGRNQNMETGGRMGTNQNKRAREAGRIGTLQNGDGAGMGRVPGETETCRNMEIGAGMGGVPVGTETCRNMGIGAGTGSNHNAGINYNLEMMRGISQNNLQELTQYNDNNFPTEFLQGPNQYNDTLQECPFNSQDYIVENYFTEFNIEPVGGTWSSQSMYDLPPY